MIAPTPRPPYYAVIFTSERTIVEEGYHGQESARENIGITVSYWASLEAIKQWKKNSEHLLAQQMGKEKWYAAYKTRICKVERDYAF